MHTRPPLARRRRSRLAAAGTGAWLALLSMFLLTGCDTIKYYRQAAAGQLDIIARQESIPRLLARTNTPPTLRRQLQLVLDLRQFAERELRLRTDGHYFKYADLGRAHVVWNVYAAPEFSLEPKKWWYPVVGSLQYRGFFAERDARAYGARLAGAGLDVYVGGVDAYSTLGWFKDPVLNTFVHQPPAELAETLFHELAHQRVFASGDTDFNEAFATCVGEEGARRWLAARGDAPSRAAYELETRHKDEFVQLIMQAREELRRVYGETESGGDTAGHGAPSETLATLRRIQKDAALARLRANYESLKTRWGGYSGYDNWFQRPLNNAHLNTVATYQHLVPAFQQLLAQHGGELEDFYKAAKAMARLDKTRRHEQLAILAAGTNHLAAATAK